jgi:enoyl-CoA hydratase
MIRTVEYQNVVIERDGPVGVVTLNRPKVLNALSPELIAELTDALGGFEADAGVGAAG